MRLVTPAAALAALVLCSSAAAAQLGPAPLTDCQKALHVLNRLGFGPRPGDVERVTAAGIPAYLEQQLHPESSSDPLVDAGLSGLPTLRMSDAELLSGFDRPLRNAERVAEKEFGKPGEAGEEAAKAYQRLIRDMVPASARPERVLEELTRARVLRAAVSEAQLNEVLVDFWMNHFNVFAGKDVDRILLTSFERDVIRPHIWGCFKDLLLATAKSPAMLLYLDNAQSVAEPDHRPGFVNAGNFSGKGKPAGGLNENYARELLELHTLGVDGGYGQWDVTELARVLTGWSSAPPEEGGGFLFRPALHDVCPKTVLGHRLPEGGGLAEGEEVLALLAEHPSTARHIAFKLCRRFIADDPPATMVSRVAARFLETGGNLRETVRAILESPEFFDPLFYRAKVKSPFEYVVSAIRALGSSTDGGVPVAREIALAGEPLYSCAPPTGYADVAAAWINTGTMLARWNFSTALAGNRIPGTEVDLARLLPPAARADPRLALEALAQLFFAGDLTEETRRVVVECVLEPDPPPGAAIPSRITLLGAVLLGSPEFQRR